MHEETDISGYRPSSKEVKLRIRRGKSPSDTDRGKKLVKRLEISIGV